MDNLGKFAYDKITGFEGIILAKTSYLYGEDQYLIQPRELEGGSIKNSQWISCRRIGIKKSLTGKTIGFTRDQEVDDPYDIEVCSIESEDELG